MGIGFPFEIGRGQSRTAKVTYSPPERNAFVASRSTRRTGKGLSRTLKITELLQKLTKTSNHHYVAYYRVSQLREGRSGFSVEGQRVAVRKYVDKHLGRVVEEFPPNNLTSK